MKKTQKKTKGTYADGFVIVIPKKKLPTYRRMAKEGLNMWMKYGALEYRECFGDDMKVMWGLPFPKMTKATKDETVIFSWIVYKSKADRNRINKQVMKGMEDYQKKHPEKNNDMPFDMKKMAYGGFKIVVSE